MYTWHYIFNYRVWHDNIKAMYACAKAAINVYPGTCFAGIHKLNLHVSFAGAGHTIKYMNLSGGIDIHALSK